MPTETTPAVPMTLEERTNALFTTVLVSPGSQIDPADLLRLHTGVVEALRTVRRETLEEAAKVADAEASRYPDYDRFSHQAAALNSATQIAQAIRSLAVKEGEGV